MELSLLNYNELYALAVRIDNEMSGNEFADLVMAFILDNNPGLIYRWYNYFSTTKEMLRCCLENYNFLLFDMNNQTE